VHTQRTDICARLTADPEHGQIPLVVELDQFALVDRPHTELTLDGGNERGPLEQRARECLEAASERLLVRQRIVEPHNSDVLLPCALLRLDEPGCAVDTDNEAPSDFGVERPRVACLLDTEDPLEPGDNFVRRWIRRLVEVDDARLDVGCQLALQRGRAGGNGSEM
jgi:hypothetical protein